MKPHLVVRLRNPVDDDALPHWTEILENKDRTSGRFHPGVLALLKRFGIEVWPTLEYHPRSRDEWSPEELRSGLDRFYRLILTESRRIPAELIHQIRLLPDVEEVRPGEVAGYELPSVARAMAVAGEAARDAIGLSEAHRFSRGHPDVLVAVLDTGVEAEHPELRDAVTVGIDFVDILDGAGEFLGDYLGVDSDFSDEVGHGTHVAGIVAGAGRAMPPGVAPACHVLAVRVLAAMRSGTRTVGAGSVDNINQGVKWAVDQGADVVNMSLGVRHDGGGLPHREVIEYALRKGASIVAASGNDGTDQLYYPGALPGVTTVGACDENGMVASFSTYGPHIALVAPGVDIYSTGLGGDYAYSTGTSHAAPFVAGGMALLRSYARERGRTLGDRGAKHVLKHSADRIDRGFRHRRAGYGRLNLADALRLLDAKLNARRN